MYVVYNTCMLFSFIYFLCSTYSMRKEWENEKEAEKWLCRHTHAHTHIPIRIYYIIHTIPCSSVLLFFCFDILFFAALIIVLINIYRLFSITYIHTHCIVLLLLLLLFCYNLRIVILILCNQQQRSCTRQRVHQPKREMSEHIARKWV